MEAKECPDNTTLTDYLLGQLESPTLDECESHIADCDKCHETLRGLTAEDTLSQQIGEAFLHAVDPDSLSGNANESQHVRGLVDRLLSQTTDHPLKPKPSSAETEILADRAAEVLRCVEPDPDNQTLGSIGDYQLIRLIGAGSTGVVFQATDQKLDRTVALKVLRPSLGPVARERFIAEARLAASIEHPNVVTIYQIDQQDRLAFIAMQWLPGETLEARLHSAATMTDEDLRRIAAQVAAGLQAAHQRQLVHRDIKPANVWISDNEGVKILDFGLARIVDEDPGLTATGMLAGTPNFMSPEQTKGSELDGRSDLFSLGCMMYRMATGKFAFGATSILGTLQSIQHEQPTPPKMVNSEISSDLSDLTMSLLEKQPANRPESAAQVVTMLESARDQWPMKIAAYQSARPASQNKPKPQASPPSYVGRWIATIAASLLALAGWYCAPQIIRIATDQGELVIETDDKEVEVQILKNGSVYRVLDTKTKNSFDIESGEYRIKATGDGNTFEVTPNSLTMKRGQRVAVTVTRTPSGQQPANSTNESIAVSPPIEKAPRLPNGNNIVFTPEATQIVHRTAEQYRNDLKQARELSEKLRGSIEELERSLKLSKESSIGQSPVMIADVQRSIRNYKDKLVSAQQDHDFAARRLQSTLRMLIQEDQLAVKASQAAANNAKRTEVLMRKGSVSFGELASARLEVERANLQLASADERLKIYHAVAQEFGVGERKKDATTKQVARQQAQTSREQPKLNKATYKGKPFDHWVNIAGTERSAEMLSDALRAGSELVETADERAELLAVVRTLARKHGTSAPGVRGRDESTKAIREQYRSAITDVMKKFEPIQFILTELEQGTSKSIALCESLIPSSRPLTNKETYFSALVERAPELLRRIVLLLEREPSNSSNQRFLYVLEDPLFSSGRRNNDNSSKLDPALVAQVKERNKDLAPTIRELFLKSSASTKAKLARLTRAYWPSDEQVEQALQAAVFDPATEPDLRDRFYHLITWEYSRWQGGFRNDGVLLRSSESLSLMFLQKLLDNQLGANSQRIQFGRGERFDFKMQNNHLRNFSHKFAGTSSSSRGYSREEPTVEGRAVMVFEILNSLLNISTEPFSNGNSTNDPIGLRKSDSSDAPDYETIKSLLAKIIAIETSADAELQADIDSMKTLLVFENANTLLDKIKTLQIFENAKPSADQIDLATYENKTFSEWINNSSAEAIASTNAMYKSDIWVKTLKAGSKLVATAKEKAALLEFVRICARQYKNYRSPDSFGKEYRRVMSAAMDKFEAKEVIQFMLTELEHGNSQSVKFCVLLIPKPAIADKESRYSAMVDQAPELLRKSVLRLQREGGSANRNFLRELGLSLWSKSDDKHKLDTTLVAQVMERNQELAPTMLELFLKSSVETRILLTPLTRAYWQADEKVELALQDAVFDPSTYSETRDDLYERIVGDYANQNSRSPDSLGLQFLQKLLANQLGPKSQRILFENLGISTRSVRDFSGHFVAPPIRETRGAERYARSTGRKSEEATIEGRAVIVNQILNSLMFIATEPVPNEKRVRLREGDVNETLAIEKIKPLLETILALETSKDVKLLADIEVMKTLLVFKNAKTLLEEIEKNHGGQTQ